MNADRREVALLEESVELGRPSDRLDKDADLQVSLDRTEPYTLTDLVELEIVEEVVELPVLLLLFELEEVLLETVEGELGLVVDVDLEGLHVSMDLKREERTYTLHELFASRADLLGEGSREHHDLLVVGSGAEDFLDVAAHVCWRG